MPSSPILSVEDLQRILKYDADTGKLFWLVRSADQFEPTKKWSSAHIARWWNSKNAGREAITANNGHGYLRSRILGRDYLAHRVAWALHHGAWPEKYIDHRNGNRQDNRIENLRSASHAENMRNKRHHSSSLSGLKGAHSDGQGRWKSSISCNGNVTRLGAFRSKESAAQAYQEKAAEMFGDFAFSGGQRDAF